MTSSLILLSLGAGGRVSMSGGLGLPLTILRDHYVAALMSLRDAGV